MLVSLLLLIGVLWAWAESRWRPATYAIRTAPTYPHGWGVKFVRVELQQGSAIVTCFIETNPSTTDPSTNQSRAFTAAEREAFRGQTQPAFDAVRWVRRTPSPYRYDPLRPWDSRWGIPYVLALPKEPFFRSNDAAFPGIYRLYQVTFALWPLGILFAAGPLWVGWRRWRGRQRARSGCCAACGYDLRASTDRCPECGSPVAVKAGSDVV